MDIQWYPGHMTKARRQMAEDLKLVDLIIELADARVPEASRNPDLAEMGKNKSRLILLNKADLADETENQKWQKYLQCSSTACLLVDSRKKADLKAIPAMVREICREKLERDARRGIKNRPIRAMVVGIPNVGKSTFINSFAGKAVTKTGNRPGVTKGKQWVRMDKNIQLLDTPGVLWAKFEDPEVGKRLAFIGSIRDELLNTEELVLELLAFIREYYPGRIAERYAAEETAELPELLRMIGEKRGCIARGNEVSYEKAAALVLDDFRSGRLGKITLERVPQGEADEHERRKRTEETGETGSREAEG